MLTDLVSPDLKGESNPKIRRESSGFRSSTPSPDFPSTFGLLLAKREKAVEFMIPTPRVPKVGAN
jgi:hypothetical protein